MPSQVRPFLVFAALLLAVGLLMVYSASMTSRPTDFEEVYLGRQLAFLGLALVSGGVAALIPASAWRRLAPWLLAGTVLFLIAVLIPSIGHAANGARRWFRFGGVSFQPSELAKVTLPLFVCTMAADGRWQTLSKFRSWLGVLLPVGLVVLLVAAEPDLGTALFLGLSSAIALFFCGWPLRRFLLGVGFVIPLALGLLVLKPYQMARITGFLSGWQDFNAAPYQVRQSLTAIGSGGLWGTGPGMGQQKLSYLPEGNTDFVLAVIGEELGLVGTLGVVALWCGLFLSGLRCLAPLPRGSFAQALGLTLLTSLVVQASINAAVVLALVPPKGISLPLISYGGSNLVASLLSLGVIVSLSRESVRQPVEVRVTPTATAATSIRWSTAEPPTLQ